MAKKWIAKRSFPWSQSFLCCSVIRFWQLFLHWNHQDLNRPNCDYRGSLEKERAKSTLRTFPKTPENPFQQMLPLQIGWWWLKGGLGRSTKSWACIFLLQPQLPTALGPCVVLKLRLYMAGVGTQPWIEQHLRGVWNQYTDNAGFPEAGLETAPKPFCSSLFSQEWRFLVELKTTLISLILCAALRNLLTLIS